MCTLHHLVCFLGSHLCSAKVRRGGVGTHFCIHKYFYDRSPAWQAIREEEDKAEETGTKVEVPDAEEVEERNDDVLHFSPIDSRHLSSLALVKARVVKLLRASQNRIHAANNLLITLVGFSWTYAKLCFSHPSRDSRTQLKPTGGSSKVESAN